MIVSDNFNIVENYQTLKRSPRIGSTSFSIDKVNSKFILETNNIEDKDNGIVKLRYEIYDMRTLDGSNTASPVKVIETSSLGSVEVNVDDETVYRAVPYTFKVFAVFNDNEKLKTLNKIMRRPILKRLNEILKDKSGIILINGALVAEFKLSYLSNNNVIIIKSSKEIQNERLKQRNLSTQMIKKILLSQFNVDDKIKAINKQIEKDKCGKIIIFNNENAKDKDISELLNNILNIYLK